MPNKKSAKFRNMAARNAAQKPQTTTKTRLSAFEVDGVDSFGRKSPIKIPGNKIAAAYAESVKNITQKGLTLGERFDNVRNPLKHEKLKNSMYMEHIKMPLTQKCLPSYTAAAGIETLILDKFPKADWTVFITTAFTSCRTLVINDPGILGQMAIKENQHRCAMMFERISKIVLGENIKKIPDGAFKGYAGLTEICGGKNVKQIGNDVVSGCDCFKKFECMKNEGVRIGTGVFVENLGHRTNENDAEPEMQEQPHETEQHQQPRETSDTMEFSGQLDIENILRRAAEQLEPFNMTEKTDFRHLFMEEMNEGNDIGAHLMNNNELYRINDNAGQNVWGKREWHTEDLRKNQVMGPKK